MPLCKQLQAAGLETQSTNTHILTHIAEATVPCLTLPPEPEKDTGVLLGKHVITQLLCPPFILLSFGHHLRPLCLHANQGVSADVVSSMLQ